MFPIPIFTDNGFLVLLLFLWVFCGFFVQLVVVVFVTLHNVANTEYVSKLMLIMMMMMIIHDNYNSLWSSAMILIYRPSGKHFTV